MVQLETAITSYIQDRHNVNQPVSIEPIGEGTIARGYRVASADRALFLRRLKPNNLSPTQADQVRSLMDGARPIPRGLPSTILGMTGDGCIVDVSAIQEYFTIGDILPEGSIKLTDVVRQEASGQDEIEEHVKVLEPYVFAMAELMAEIHSDTSNPPPDGVDPYVLYERSTGAIIHSRELTVGLLDHVNRHQSTWITSDNTDMFLSYMVQARRNLGVHPDRVTGIHGDYWGDNVYFTPDGQIVTGDTRTGWGEPGIDAGWMIGEILLQDLRKTGEFGGPYTALAARAIDHYVSLRGDREVYKFMALPYGFQTLGEAVFAPGLSDETRRQLVETGCGALVAAVEDRPFDFGELNEYSTVGRIMFGRY